MANFLMDLLSQLTMSVPNKGDLYLEDGTEAG